MTKTAVVEDAIHQPFTPRNARVTKNLGQFIARLRCIFVLDEVRACAFRTQKGTENHLRIDAGGSLPACARRYVLFPNLLERIDSRWHLGDVRRFFTKSRDKVQDHASWSSSKTGFVLPTRALVRCRCRRGLLWDPEPLKLEDQRRDGQRWQTFREYSGDSRKVALDRRYHKRIKHQAPCDTLAHPPAVVLSRFHALRAHKLCSPSIRLAALLQSPRLHPSSLASPLVLPRRLHLRRTRTLRARGPASSARRAVTQKRSPRPTDFTPRPRPPAAALTVSTLLGRSARVVLAVELPPTTLVPPLFTRWESRAGGLRIGTSRTRPAARITDSTRLALARKSALVVLGRASTPVDTGRGAGDAWVPPPLGSTLDPLDTSWSSKSRGTESRHVRDGTRGGKDEGGIWNAGKAARGLAGADAAFMKTTQKTRSQCRLGLGLQRSRES
ncbi:hypothetical protein C8R45DRAFT_1209219 [Mycena sanguinolenta]|nr:hypothetical protein C8R45DRAFT_1209219 [Mycena sanguinolenta]